MLEDPLFIAGAVVVLLIFLGIKKFSNKKLADRINPENMEDRAEKVFREPVIKRGSLVKDYIKMRGTSNTPQVIGYAVKSKDHDIDVLTRADEENQEKYKTKTVEGTTYAVIQGSSKSSIQMKYFLAKIGVMRYVDIFDVPKQNILDADDYIWFSHKTHFVNYNGVYRTLTQDGMNRVQEATFSKTHENSLETIQNIPEQYTVLNNRLAGQIKLENIKSENIKEYVESKNRSGKRSAMQD